ncbi:hypothetical protein T265_09610 [Opisthorchis viverrini]|uniref:Uncharacterized protein n=1 Tax=Opisthorchis viverrini TaxID=6198 RepID=A0A074Z596_OPIVI|nr:hypothetical protein T265_09610 [Opisthorchis viverrini]KER22243.1 hypothetical protein T265_09610 [Opisthorchis viverrini]
MTDDKHDYCSGSSCILRFVLFIYLVPSFQIISQVIWSIPTTLRASKHTLLISSAFRLYIYRDIPNIVPTETRGGLVQHIQFFKKNIINKRFIWVPATLRTKLLFHTNFQTRKVFSPVMFLSAFVQNTGDHPQRTVGPVAHDTENKEHAVYDRATSRASTQVNLVFTGDSSESLVYDVFQLNVLYPGRLMFQLARYSRHRRIFFS